MDNDGKNAALLVTTNMARITTSVWADVCDSDSSGRLVGHKRQRRIAVRSQPLDLGGTPKHRPGSLIGEAVETIDEIVRLGLVKMQTTQENSHVILDSSVK
jgi:hypothetical protein